MKPTALAAIFAVLLLSAAAVLAADNQSLVTQKMNSTQLVFTRNIGQWDNRVLFRADADGATMWFTREGVTYQFTRHIPGRSNESDNPGSEGAAPRGYPHEGNYMRLHPRDPGASDSIEQLVLTARFVGANPNPEVVGEKEMEYKCNYFLGSDPTQWRTDVPNYEAIRLRDVYPGIDLTYSSDGDGQAVYEFIVAPNADIAQIKVAYEGAEVTSLDDEGKLILQTRWGDMVAAITSPSHDALSGRASFLQVSGDVVGLKTAGANRQALSSIAVGLVYSTYLGGGFIEIGKGIAVNASGNAYVTGQTLSSDFPILNPCQEILQDDWDIFVTKLSGPGNSLIYSTYLGGDGDDDASAIAVDANGNAHVAGRTGSLDFPTLNPYQTDQGNDDVFVAKLNSTGNSLIYSTYLGGENRDWGNGIAVDGSGNAYVTGATGSSNFPTLNPYQANQAASGSYGAFVTKLSSAGASLIFGTYLGGDGDDGGNAIAVDGSGCAYVTGWTGSSNFPILNPCQATFQGGYRDAFVAKLSDSGSSLVYSTYLGGGASDLGYGIAVDGSGRASVTGQTGSSNFPTLNPYQTYQGGEDVFATTISSSGSSLVYSTYLGGEKDDYGHGIAVDGSGNTYVTGNTSSTNFPTLNPYQINQGYADVFVTKLSSSSASLTYSTCLGGAVDNDYGLGIAVDGNGNAYVTGGTFSDDFPTLNPFQTDPPFENAFVTKLGHFPYVCSDASGDGNVNISDAVYLIAYIFAGGPSPNPLLSGDANCDSAVNISDAVYLIAYIFSGGPLPCAGCK